MQQKNKNCAVVDVGAVCEDGQPKKFVDMSGNNINHPNDFLHLIYPTLFWITGTGTKKFIPITKLG